MLWGKGVRPGSDPGEFELIDIAPTLAAMMGVSLPDAEGVNRLA